MNIFRKKDSSKTYNASGLDSLGNIDGLVDGKLFKDKWAKSESSDPGIVKDIGKGRGGRKEISQGMPRQSENEIAVKSRETVRTNLFSGFVVEFGGL